MKTKITIALLALAASAQAQDLSTEINVDRTVLPEQHLAAKPQIAPRLLPLPQSESELFMAEYLMPGAVSSMAGRLPASIWADSVGVMPYKGYATLGYFPALNVCANMGIDLLRTRCTSVGGWAQYCTRRYKADGLKRGGDYFTVGLDAAHRFANNSRISLDIDYSFSNVLRQRWPFDADDDMINSGATTHEVGQQSNEFKGVVAWDSRIKMVSYDISAGVKYFGFKDTTKIDGNERCIDQTSLVFDANAGLTRSGSSARWIGIDIDGQVMRSNHGFPTRSMFHLRPYYTLDVLAFKGRIGINASVGSEKAAVAPEVRLAWAPERKPVAAYLNFIGHKQLNQLANLFAINNQLNPYVAYGASNIPIHISAGINIGRIGGFSMEVFAEMAAARDWLMPVIITNQALQLGVSQFSEHNNFTAWHFGAKASYELKQWATLSVGYERAGSNHAGCATWYDWYDCAKQQLNAGLEIRPVQRLRIGASYLLRTHRRLAIVNPGAEDATLRLGRLSDLGINASYTISPAITAFINIENALCCRYRLVSGVPAQKIKGIAGVSFKF